MIFLDTETTSLNADTGMLNTIGLIMPNGETKFFFADDVDKEKEIIQQAVDFLKNFPNEQITMWFSGFDMPFIVTRAIKNNLDVSEIYNFKIIDLCRLVQNNLKFSSNKLDDVARFLNVEKNYSFTGREMQALYMSAVKGDAEAKQKIIDHCNDDLQAMKKTFEKLKPYVDVWLKKNLRFK